MTEFLTILAACSPLIKATAAFLEGAAIFLAVWTPISIAGVLMFGRSIHRGWIR